jgi:predicted AAA+ superfamily ATPase
MANKRRLEEALHFHNPWWLQEKVPGELLEKFKRPVFEQIIEYLKLKRILILKGPRRVGKTSLAYQVIDYLLGKGVPPQNILFLSFDDPKAREDLDEIFKVYETIAGKTIEEMKTVYCFLDEVHFLPHWEFFVKKYFDKKYPIKFIVSGSAATLIKKSSESLAGRTVEESLFPFSFFEYLLYKIKDAQIIKELEARRQTFNLRKLPAPLPAPIEKILKIHLKEYQRRGGFPHVFGTTEKHLWHKLLYEDVVEKVVYKDLVELYDVRQPQILEKLLLYASGISGQILNISNIANSIGLSREFVEKYLSYLENAYLLFTLKKYAPTIEKQIRSLEKVHLIDCGLISILDRPAEGNVVESFLAQHFYRRNEKHLYYFKDKFEVDLVYSQPGNRPKGKSIIPIEVKTGDRIKTGDLNGLSNFMERYNERLGIITSYEQLDKLKIKSREILVIPYWFLAALL